MKINKVLMKGNEALCEGAIAADCQSYFGYPITPQNEIPAYMSRRMPELNRVFLQAESELAAINMVFGTALTGKRTMTSSSSPGISLKQEGISYLAACELPAVVVNVQRGGPGLGNISASQSDYFQATRGGGHGDYRTIVLAPNSVQEMYSLTMVAFDLADKYRTPVLILSDGIIGQMVEPLFLESYKPIPLPPKNWVLDGCYQREPRYIRSLLMAKGQLEQHNWHLADKYLAIKRNECQYESLAISKCDWVIVSFGITSRICKSVVNLAQQNKVRVGYFRPVTLWPFPAEELRNYVILNKNKRSNRCPKVLVVEMNLGQMVEDVKLALTDTGVPIHFYGRPGGGIPTVEEIYSQIIKL